MEIAVNAKLIRKAKNILRKNLLVKSKKPKIQFIKDGKPLLSLDERLNALVILHGPEYVQQTLNIVLVDRAIENYKNHQKVKNLTF